MPAVGQSRARKSGFLRPLKHGGRSGTAGLWYRLLLAVVGAAAGIGSANFIASANPQGISLIADRSSRELLVAHDTMRNERIDTIDRGQVQLLFADQSSLSVAPDSDVVINEFLYDPQTQTGNLSATVTTGVLRYVAGQIGRTRDVTFYTPTAVVTVRGGIILINAGRGARLDPTGGARTEIVFLSGDRMCVTGSGQTQCTTKFATAITSVRGQPPSAPAQVTTEMIETLFSSLQAVNQGAPTDALAQSASRAAPAAVHFAPN
jgi:hypothetical protein